VVPFRAFAAPVPVLVAMGAPYRRKHI
jgi:hypothetical protein